MNEEDKIKKNLNASLMYIFVADIMAAVIFFVVYLLLKNIVILILSILMIVLSIVFLFYINKLKKKYSDIFKQR